MFCSYCGAKANENDVFCQVCGKPLDIYPEVDTSSSSGETTPSYGDTTPSYEETDALKSESSPSYEAYPPSGDDEKPVKMQPSFSDFVDRAQETASKAVDQAKALATQTKDRIEKSSDKELEKAIKRSESKNQQKDGIVSNNYKGSNYMSTSELWTWLKKDSKRQQFYTEGGFEESEAEYMEELQSKLENNSVPVKIEKRKICWDRSNAVEEVYVVIPETKVVNPLTYLVQFCHVGDFTFVEEKTFITPPDLPERPGEKLTIPKAIAMAMLYIAVAAVILFILSGFLRYEAGTCILASLILAGIDIFIWFRYKKIWRFCSLGG